MPPGTYMAFTGVSKRIAQIREGHPIGLTGEIGPGDKHHLASSQQALAVDVKAPVSASSPTARAGESTCPRHRPTRPR